jgi:hypothetical protein
MRAAKDVKYCWLIPIVYQEISCQGSCGSLDRGFDSGQLYQICEGEASDNEVSPGRVRLEPLG